MPSEVIYEEDARSKIFKGIETLARSVSTTLGPRGKNVAIARSTPDGKVYERIVLHDGVSVAKAIDPKEPFENLGASILREAAQKQVDAVGDGTTVTITLAHAIIKEALKQMSSGMSPMYIRKELESSVDKLCKELDNYAIPVKTLEDKKNVANISAEDKELGDIIANVIHDVGEDGILTVEESKNAETTVEKQEGMQIDKGYAHPYFVTDMVKMTATLDDTPVLITDKPLTSIAELGKFLNEKVFPKTKKLVFISPEFGGDLLPVLLENKMSGNFLSLAVNAPSFGDNQVQFLQDLAILTGAKFISKDAGHNFDDLTFEDLGHADKITASKSSTILIGGHGDKKSIESRIDSIREQIKNVDTDFYREKLKERLGKLTNGIAVLRVGGQTEVEMKERKERALDAIAAVKAAIKEGIIPGGETIYLKIRDIAQSEIMYQALEKPFTKLVENAGLNAGQMMERLANSDPNCGVDVNTGCVTNMLKDGIIDPVMVAKMALRNAVSVACQTITIGAAIVPCQDEKVS